LNLNIYILTGGNSTRMGTDKALLNLKGQSFIQHILKSVVFLNTTIQLVSSKLQHQNLEYDSVQDIEINKGPISGLVSALNDSSKQWNLILSCDIPLLKEDFIKWLIANHDTNYSATIGVVKNKKMPLTAIYDKECEWIFRRHLNENQLKVMTALDDIKVNYLEVPEKFHYQLANINTPQQLKEISV